MSIFQYERHAAESVEQREARLHHMSILQRDRSAAESVK